MKSRQDRTEGDVNRSASRDAWRREQIDPQTARLLDQDAEYFLHQSMSTPCLNALGSSKGAVITDLQGREFLDFHGNSVHQVGFGNDRVVKAVIDQLRTLPFCPRRYTNRPAVDLARRLSDLSPGDLGKTLLAPGGALAMGMALKLARIATGRFKTVSWWDSFHGASLDAVSIGGEAVFREGMGPLMPGAVHIPPPSAYRSAFGSNEPNEMESADYLEYVMAREGDISAFIAEPVRNTHVIVPSKVYWQRVREICDRHGALLIFDEVPTCLGRTGRLFACEHFDVAPDILVIGKGLGGGVFPLAAMIARKNLDLADHTSLGHYTHEKSPVGAAAALATLDVIREEKLVERAAGIGAEFLARLQRLKDKHPIIGDVRGIGMLWGIELVRDRSTRAPAEQEAEQVMYTALKQGLSFKVSGGNILTLSPALTITDAELERALVILDSSLAEATRNRLSLARRI